MAATKSKPQPVAMYKVWKGWADDKLVVTSLLVIPYGRGWKTADGSRPGCLRCRTTAEQAELFPSAREAIIAYIMQRRSEIAGLHNKIQDLERSISEVECLYATEPVEAD